MSLQAEQNLKKQQGIGTDQMENAMNEIEFQVYLLMLKHTSLKQKTN